MERDFNAGGRKRIDVAIFHHSANHTIDPLSRIVLWPDRRAHSYAQRKGRR